MESMTFDFTLSGARSKGQRTVCGVVGSGNLEVIVEENNSLKTRFEIETAVEHYKPIWSMVVEDFVNEYQPVGLKFVLNDNGAPPPVVSLRLKQAFEAFKEKGIFNKEVAKSFHDNILSAGGSEHPSILYKRFRGRDADPKALLRREGMIK
jgi:malonate decarboxylase acyl carrier protein